MPANSLNTQNNALTNFPENEHGNNIIHFYVIKNDLIQLMSTLAKYQNDPNLLAEALVSKTKEGDTPLHLAIFYKVDSSILTVILEYAKKLGIVDQLIEIENNQGFTPLYFCELLQVISFTRNIPIHPSYTKASIYVSSYHKDLTINERILLVIQHKDLKSLNFIINSVHDDSDKKQLLFTQDQDGNTLLHIAAKNNDRGMIFVINSHANSMNCLDDLLQTKNNAGFTASEWLTNQINQLTVFIPECSQVIAYKEMIYTMENKNLSTSHASQEATRRNSPENARGR